jgi:hypothetical protein
LKIGDRVVKFKYLWAEGSVVYPSFYYFIRGNIFFYPWLHHSYEKLRTGELAKELSIWLKHLLQKLKLSVPHWLLPRHGKRMEMLNHLIGTAGLRLPLVGNKYLP